MAKNVKAIYDTCSALVKQAEAQAAQGKEPDPAILEALKNAFTDILEFEKVYLIQCQDRFYGSILMDLDLTVDFKQRGAVDLKIDHSPFVIGVNPLFCAQYKFPEFTGLIIGEILRMVYLHPATYAEKNTEKDDKKHEDLEKASSAATSTIIKHDIRLVADEDYGGKNGCRLPEGTYTATSLNEELNVRSKEDMPIDYYYNILEKFGKDKKSGNGIPMPMAGMGVPGQGQGQPSPGQGQPNPNGVATQNNSNGQQTHNWEGADKDEVKSQITSIVSNAYNSLSEKARGNMPASILQQIQALLAPPQIDWKGVLRKMVGSIPVPYRKTRKRLNRRQPERADLRGRLPKRTVNIVVAFDTSGSMSDDDLKYCMNEVFNIVKVYEGFKITVVECDCEIGKIYEAKKMSDLQLKMSGRGGTSFSPVIEYINGEGKYANNPKYPHAGHFKDALMIYFTDGYGEYEIPKPKTYRNLWVVLEDEKNLSLKNPYGDVKALAKDEDWKKMRGR